jgi:photosystem II stability/assembly factor-like uncharacterized protein
VTFLRDWIVPLAVVCVVVSPQLARGGEKLRPSEIRQNLFSACFFTAQEGWVVGELGSILHTSDGGKTFDKADAGTKTAFLSVACLPGGAVIVTGQYGLILRSQDNGATWEKLETGVERNLLGISFGNDRVGVAVGDYGTIVRTTDGGTTWTKVPLPEDIPLPEEIAEIIEPGDVLLYDVEFIDAERAWIVGEFGVIFATTDGGQSWVAQQSNIETTLFGVSFADSQNGWAVGLEQVMLHTTDGGQSWGEQRTAGRQGFVLGIYDVAVDGNYGWAIGDSGLLLQSTDAGRTWKQVELPIQVAANWFRGIAMTPGAVGYIVGSEGLILSTEREQFRDLKEPS